MNEKLHRLIEQQAYQLWENADRPDGRELEFWLQAEQQIGMVAGPDEVDPYMAPDDLEPGEFERREQASEFGARLGAVSH